MRDVYQPYLDALVSAQPVRDMASNPDRANIVALRHDVDYCIDTALKMAWLEHQNGVSATYYILHTADYMADPDLYKKCRQIQAFGHEIGLHTNFLADWYAHEGKRPDESLAGTLAGFRKEGLNITGVAAHGDPACYEGQFTNYWLFSEIRPEADYEGERRVLAEGVAAPPDRSRVISYPDENHTLTRSDGQTFDFWSLSLEGFGLVYEASRTSFDNYYTDSRGSWLGHDPLKANLEVGRHQILMHPWHWRGELRHTYFIGPARSGTKWLSGLLSNASTVRAEHEVTLNIQSDNPEADQSVTKNTTTRFRNLLENSDEIDRLIAMARSRSERFTTDYAEANIYLVEVLDKLPHGSNTSIVHLVRDPKDVVRSLWQRSWYDVPYDPRHPAIDAPDWDNLSQLEQICWYVRRTHERLITHRDGVLKFETMVGDRAALAQYLADYEIGLCPDLAGEIFSVSENITPKWDVPEYGQWNDTDRKIFIRILGPMTRELGYDLDFEDIDPVKAATTVQTSKPQKPSLIVDHLPEPGSGPITLSNVVCRDSRYIFAPEQSGNMILGGGVWKAENLAIRPMIDLDELRSDTQSQLFHAMGGWPVVLRHIYTLDMDVDIIGAPVRVLCVSHDAEGHLISQTGLATLTPDKGRLCLHFKPARLAQFFNLVLFSGAKSGPCELNVNAFRLARQVEDRRSMLTAEKTFGELSELNAPLVPKPKTLTLPVFNTDVQIPVWNADISLSDTGYRVSPQNAEKPCLFVCSGGHWRNSKRWADPAHTGEGEPEVLSPSDKTPSWAGCVNVKVHDPEAKLSVFLLNYDKEGVLRYTVRLGVISTIQESVPIFLAPQTTDEYWSIGLYLPAGQGGFNILR